MLWCCGVELLLAKALDILDKTNGHGLGKKIYCSFDQTGHGWYIITPPIDPQP